jgi:glucosamine--fructose-6-phosphate aminotransferase (isomerizing)
MCGIVGYTGPDEVLPILLNGLARLEYRGYDSAGVALLERDHGEPRLWIRRRPGKLSELKRVFDDDVPHTSRLGIGHTRWATHGGPTEANAHPHTDETGKLAIVHNGIVENFAEIRRELLAVGVPLTSDTDTELVAHLIGRHLVAHGGTLAEAVRHVLNGLEGALAVVVVHTDFPDLIVAARMGPPLVAGLTGDAGLVASDIPAMLEHTRDIYVVEDRRVIEVRPGTIQAWDLEGNEVAIPRRTVSWSVEAAQKSTADGRTFEDFMLKEIHEQPEAVRHTLRGRTDAGSHRLHLDDMRLTEDDLRNVDRVSILGCGTSFHSGMVAKYAIEHWTRLPCEVDLSSEYRYRDPVLDARTLVIGVSQSGETADTIEACKHARHWDAKVVAVTNVVDSSMARDADAVLYTHAGPEIGVAATKTFLAQVTALQLFALYLAQVRGTMKPEVTGQLLNELHRLPEKIETVVGLSDSLREVAAAYYECRDFFFIGRGVGYPTALEGALKLKEISYVRAEGFPAGELKHGPIALIEPGVVVVGVCTRSLVRLKTLSNVQEVKARGATIVLVANEGDREAAEVADVLITVPATEELFTPAIDVVALQLLSYWVAKFRGTDVDMPRNLAKTVTVE